jgi:hypothetical protein
MLSGDVVVFPIRQSIGELWAFQLGHDHEAIKLIGLKFHQNSMSL